MTVVKHYCDVCSEQITSERTLLLMKSGPERLKRPEIELCTACLPKLTKLLDTTVAGDTQPTPRANKAARVAARA